MDFEFRRTHVDAGDEARQSTRLPYLSLPSQVSASLVVSAAKCPQKSLCMLWQLCHLAQRIRRRAALAGLVRLLSAPAFPWATNGERASRASMDTRLSTREPLNELSRRLFRCNDLSASHSVPHGCWCL
jgi:hypothetical protein